MLLIKISEKFQKEKLWVIDVVLNEFLGLNYNVVIERNNNENVVIDYHGKRLIINTPFFSLPENEWLNKSSLPSLPLGIWDIPDNFNSRALVENSVPILYGTSGFKCDFDQDAVLNLDIFGSVFFMLSRYEEFIIKDLDEHKRFPSIASLAYKAGFLNRPIVDQYVEIFWQSIKAVWPELKRKQRIFKKAISCDVDDPYSKSVKNIKALPKEIAVALIKHKDFKLASSLALNSIASRMRCYAFEPYDTFDWMMERSEKQGNNITFYFIAGHSAGKIDGCYSLAEPRVRLLMKTISERGHKIGLHGSYNTYNNAKQLCYEADLLRETLSSLDIVQDSIGCRQHYLRWQASITPRILNDAGFTYDSTLGFADRPGFRCGTSHEYTMFDLSAGKPLLIKQRPLVVMESSIISKRYLGLGYGKETQELFQYYRDICITYNSPFSLLWHNSYLTTAKDRLLYGSLI